MKTRRQTLIKNIGALFGAQILASLLTPILFVFISRTLGSEVFGKYSFLVALTGVFLLIAEFGMKSVAIRDVARDLSSLDNYFRNIALIKFIFSVFAILLFIIAIHILDMPRDTTLASYFFAGGLFFQSMSFAFRWIFHATQKMEKEAFQRVAERLLILILSLLAVGQGFGLIALAFAFFLTQFAIFIFSLLFARKLVKLEWRQVNLSFGRAILPTAFFFGLCEAAYMFFFRIDVIMLGKLQSEVDAGWYNAAYVIVSFISIISLLLVQVMFPIFSDLFENDREDLKNITERLFRYLMIIGLPIIPLVALFSDQIIGLLYGSGFDGSSMILKILICNLVIILPAALFAGILSASNMHKNVAFINLLGMLVNVILNFLFIPRYGHIGASVSAMVTQVVLCVFLYRGVLQVINIKIAGILIHILPVFAVMVIIVNLPVDLPLILLSIIATVVYLFLSYLTGSIRNDDIAYISGFFVEGKQSLY